MRDIVPTPTPWDKGPYAGRPYPRADNGPDCCQANTAKTWVNGVNAVNAWVNAVNEHIAHGK